MTTFSPPSPDFQPVERQTVWPMVIGIIGIVMGALAALGGCMGAVSSLVMPSFASQLESVVPAGQPTGMEGLKAYSTELAIVSLLASLVAVVILIAGIKLVRRKPVSRPLFIGWAVTKMLLVIPSSALQYLMQKANFDAMAGDPNMAGVPANFFDVIVTFIPIFTVLWGWALPVFILIWFLRRPIRDEVASWRDASAAATFDMPLR